MEGKIGIRPRIDWRIPFPVILAILVQTAAFIVWAAGWKSEISNRVSALEKWTEQNNQVIERVTRVEEKITSLKEQSTRIEGKLDQAIERRGR
jgi:hypothetical protein